MHGFMSRHRPGVRGRDHVVCTRRIRDVLVTTLWISTAASSLASAQAGGGGITPPLSPRNANYTIAARLDPATRTITGSETIVWRNITSTTANELQFHLYWNAWKHPRTTWMRELALAGARSESDRPSGDWSHIDVTAIRLTTPSAF